MTSDRLNCSGPEESYFNMNNNGSETLQNSLQLGHLEMGIRIADKIRISKQLIQNKGMTSDLSIEITTALKNVRGKLKTETEQ